MRTPRQQQVSKEQVSKVSEAQSSKAEWEASQKRKEHLARHQKLRSLREQDARSIQDRCARNLKSRERRFEALMDNIQAEDVVRVEAAWTIRQHEAERADRSHALHERWEQEVNQRVQSQLQKYMTQQPENAPAYRDLLLPGDDPLKRPLHEHRAEEKFRRAADLVIAGASPRGEPKSARGQREASRFVLEPERWSQLHHYASPYGHFTQSCERQGGSVGFHSARRMGTDVHLMDESDGVPIAGKGKHRQQRNLLGQLEGVRAREGESALRKSAAGCSSGAPNQDHYDVEIGNAVVDAEFPLGKRCYPGLRA